MFERFTNRARTVVAGAQDEARALGSPQIGAEHLLLGILDEGGGIGAKVLSGLGIERSAVLAGLADPGDADAEALRAIGIDMDEVRRRAEAAFGPGALDRPPAAGGQSAKAGGRRRRRPGGHLPFDDSAKRVLSGALTAAKELGNNYIGTEHLLLGLVADAGSPATLLLRRLGMTADTVELRALVAAELRRAA